jgi:hypothetical protein
MRPESHFRVGHRKTTIRWLQMATAHPAPFGRRSAGRHCTQSARAETYPHLVVFRWRQRDPSRKPTYPTSRAVAGTRWSQQRQRRKRTQARRRAAEGKGLVRANPWKATGKHSRRTALDWRWVRTRTARMPDALAVCIVRTLASQPRSPCRKHLGSMLTPTATSSAPSSAD